MTDPGYPEPMARVRAIRVVIAAVVAAVMAIAASPAAADVPCAANSAPAYKFEKSLPPKLGYGFTARFDLDFNADYAGAYVGSDAIRVEVAAADPTRPISHPYAVSGAEALGGTDWDDFAGRFTLRLERGDGPAIVRATWQESSGYDYDATTCTRTVTATVTPQQGEKLRPKVTVRSGGRVLFDFIGADRCRDSTDASQRVTVAGMGRTRRLFARHFCSPWKPRKADAGRWLLDGRGGGPAIFRPRLRRSGTAIFSYKQLIGRRVAKRGRFRLTTVHRPRRRVWEGTDAFVNFCINGEYTIWSKGGRLFCWKPARTRHTARMIR